MLQSKRLPAVRQGTPWVWETLGDHGWASAFQIRGAEATEDDPPKPRIEPLLFLSFSGSNNRAQEGPRCRSNSIDQCHHHWTASRCSSHAFWYAGKQPNMGRRQAVWFEAFTRQ